jgi:hypothetical protein
MKPQNVFTSLAAAVVAVLSVGLASSFAGDIPGSKDHPLLDRFAGAEIIRYKAATDSLDFYDQDKKKLTFTGRMVRVEYRLPAGHASAVNIFQHYERQMKAAGWDLLNSGANRTPLGCAALVGQRGLNPLFKDLTPPPGVIPIIAPTAMRSSYYIYAVKKDAAGDLHCSVLVGEFNTADGAFKVGDIVISVDSVQEKPAAKN